MGYSFDGATRRISLTSGTTTLDVRDCYSRWKDWVQTADNARFLAAFAVVGGEPIDAGAGVYITSYFFLSNDWRVKPQEASHTLTVENGVLLTDDGDDPIVPTTGTYQVLARFSQPIKSETIATGGAASPDWDELLDLADAVETGLTLRQALRLVAAVLGGTLSGAEDLAPVFRAALTNHKPRVTSDGDAHGNRVAVTLDLD
jgi:hypothetical protein